LTAFKQGKPLETQSFIKFFGEERYKVLVKFILRYIADLDIPIQRYTTPYFLVCYDDLNLHLRGTFVEFRNGMINVSPIGRNATIQERFDFEAYDKQHGIRTAFVKVLREKFSEWGLTFSIGGQISFDIFPNG
jgi:phosphomannomutase